MNYSVMYNKIYILPLQAANSHLWHKGDRRRSRSLINPRFCAQPFAGAEKADEIVFISEMRPPSHPLSRASSLDLDASAQTIMHPRAHPPRNTSHDIIEEENDAYFSFPRVILGPMTTRCELRKAAKEEKKRTAAAAATGSEIHRETT